MVEVGGQLFRLVADADEDDGGLGSSSPPPTIPPTIVSSNGGGTSIGFGDSGCSLGGGDSFLGGGGGGSNLSAGGGGGSNLGAQVLGPSPFEGGGGANPFLLGGYDDPALIGGRSSGDAHLLGGGGGGGGGSDFNLGCGGGGDFEAPVIAAAPVIAEGRGVSWTEGMVSGGGLVTAGVCGGIGISADCFSPVPNFVPSRSLASDPIWASMMSRRLTLFVHDESRQVLFVIPRRGVGVVQCYVARRLDWKHCVMPLSSASTILADCIPQSVLYYDPTVSHADEYFIVLNELRHTADEICNSGAICGLLDPAALPPANQAGRQDKGTILNAGYCGTQSMGKRGTDGVPVPSLKEFSRDEPLLSSTVRVSNFLDTVAIPWLPLGLRQTLADENRLSFAAAIAPNNIFDASTHCCRSTTAWHSDTGNPLPSPDGSGSPSAASLVVCVSTDAQTHVFYQRKSVDVSLSWSKVIRTYLDDAATFWSHLGPTTRVYSPASVPQGDGLVQSMPSIDPIGFHSLFLVSTLAVVDRRRLNLLETCGLLLVMLRLPNRAEPYFKAVKEALENPASIRGRGFDFSFELMASVASKASVRELHARWNSNHWSILMPKRELHLAQGYYLFSIVVHVNAAFPRKPTSARIAEDYRRVVGMLESADLCDNVGPLTSRHFASILSKLGVLPIWIGDFAELDTGGRVYKFFADRFGWSPHKAYAKKLTAALMIALPNEFGVDGPWTVDVVENFICKHMQGIKAQLSGRNNPARDQHHVRAPVVHRVGAHLKFTVGGKSTSLEGGGLIQRWPLKGRFLWTIQELAEELNIPTTLPETADILGYRPPAWMKADARMSANHLAFGDWWKDK
jgi:hypothetical protein